MAHDRHERCSRQTTPNRGWGRESNMGADPRSRNASKLPLAVIRTRQKACPRGFTRLPPEVGSVLHP